MPPPWLRAAGAAHAEDRTPVRPSPSSSPLIANDHHHESGSPSYRPSGRPAQRDEEEPLVASSPPAEECQRCEGSSSPEPAHDILAKERELVAAFSTILRCIGEDPERPGLRATPERAARALRAATAGYQQSAAAVANGALFELTPTRSAGVVPAPAGMVVVRGIRIHSLCEHHLLPFYGHAHIGYMPGRSVLGLSKLARIADVFARRLQMQERLTQQIADALAEVTEARGVAVAIECAHMCMCSRGVNQTGALTLTSAMSGVFEADLALRDEFWRQVQGTANVGGSAASRL